VKTSQSDFIQRSPDTGAARAVSPSAPAEGPAEPPPLPSERERRIAERAYQRYEQRNGEAGDSMQDWLDAEREVDGNGTDGSGKK
jgi:hypothetical protein